MALVSCKECGDRISDRASTCPHCGAPTGVPPPPGAQAVGGPQGFEYRSAAELFGVPLIHIAMGVDPATGKKRIAKGIIAIGDIAVGVLALGGIALGGLTLGGLSLGFVALGGMGVGILAGFGGMAVGYIAVGGLAIGVYAYGGLALGAHVVSGGHVDPEALEFFRDKLGLIIEAPGGRSLPAEMPNR